MGVTLVNDVELRSYADIVNLNAGFDRSVSSTIPRQVLLERAAAWLLYDAGLDAEVPADEEARRRIVTKLLTVRPPRPIDSAALQTLDELFAADAECRPVVQLADVLGGPDAPFAVPGTRVRVWRGDITTLVVDGIVNAANSGLLGCFKPGHQCIDNAIHSAAGPRLREDCHRIVDRLGKDEPTGTAKATRGYYLPAKFVLHTVGPIVADGQVTPEHREQLARSYEACLDLAAAIGLRSIAFCSVSTGVFGYPKREAAEVATFTVREWLLRHPHALDTVIFNVFTAADEEAYSHTGSGPPSARESEPFQRALKQLRQWIDESDRVLVGAGAGLSADAGVDYRDEADFAAKFPAVVKRGLRAAYQMIGYTDLPVEALWGYWLLHVNEVRFSEGRRRVYERLFELVGRKDWFVLTSNVDALFARNGFDPERVCSIQGDFAFLQCLKPCSNDLWPSAPVLERLLPEIDSATQALRDPSLVPTCPRCGGAVFFNVRGGEWFVEQPWRRQFGTLRSWVASSSNERLLVLDIGSGFNTPSVVRWPMERTAEAIPTARFARINRHDPALHTELGPRALSIAAGALEVLEGVGDRSAEDGDRSSRDRGSALT